jgi:hypothetical protein
MDFISIVSRSVRLQPYVRVCVMQNRKTMKEYHGKIHLVINIEMALGIRRHRNIYKSSAVVQQNLVCFVDTITTTIYLLQIDEAKKAATSQKI